MSRLIIALLVIAPFSFAGVGSAQTTASPTDGAQTSLTKERYAEAKKKADEQYQVDRRSCLALSGNAKDICVAEAKGKNDIARAEAAAAYENTPRTRENARVAHARAVHDVSMEKCDDLAGNPKDVCVQEAKAAFVKGKADARVDRIAGNARKDPTGIQADAVKKANAEKREADYKVALEKCDAFAGPAKDACVGNAKMHYGKS